ncbi:hypothetical protein IHO40_04450 [Wolbachia endosymbiont of Mansonella ozzardi]|nr:hypothetical protein [Wolbachia endosymbiont of Mansonella ozzardi]
MMFQKKLEEIAKDLLPESHCGFKAIGNFNMVFLDKYKRSAENKTEDSM